MKGHRCGAAAADTYVELGLGEALTVGAQDLVAGGHREQLPFTIGQEDLFVVCRVRGQVHVLHWG